MNDARPPALPRGFSFLDSPRDFQDSTATVVRIPAGIRGKQKLFAIYATALRFPKYFGWNWDAFEECLNDLSWLPPDKPIVLVHEDLPFGAGGENRGIYIDVLHKATADLKVIWPTTARASLNSATNEPH